MLVQDFQKNRFDSSDEEQLIRLWLDKSIWLLMISCMPSHIIVSFMQGFISLLKKECLFPPCQYISWYIAETRKLEQASKRVFFLRCGFKTEEVPSCYMRYSRPHIFIQCGGFAIAPGAHTFYHQSPIGTSCCWASQGGGLSQTEIPATIKPFTFLWYTPYLLLARSLAKDMRG